jgi:hypothetical protein
MLQAKPITNVPTRIIPKIIINFSLSFIFTFNYLLILFVNQVAFLNNLSSSKRDETSCMPIGRLFFPCNNGKLIDGIPQYVQTVQNIGSPVDFKPCGASPVEDGVSIAS